LDNKIRENRLRRMAKRQGLALAKSRRRDPNALGFGLFMVVDPNLNSGSLIGFSLDLDGVEDWLTTSPDQRPRP
jgi:hypothetical protein